MTVKIDGLRLWQAQEDQSSTKGGVETNSVFGTDSDRALLTGLEKVDSFQYSGLVSGIRLSQQSGYSNDPLTALAEWVAKFETVVNANQGTGWTLDDQERGRTINVVARQVGWQRLQGANYEVEWDLDVLWGQGEMDSLSRSPDSVSPSADTQATLSGTSLGSIEATRQQKRQRLKMFPIAFADSGENDTLAQSGAIREIILRGVKTGSQSTLNTFASDIRSLIGQDQIVDFSSAFPGRTKQVMVDDFETTRSAGVPRQQPYTLKLIEGVS